MTSVSPIAGSGPPVRPVATVDSGGDKIIIASIPVDPHRPKEPS